MAVRDVLIVGAGPAGLATAIAARQLGLDHQVVEQGSIVDAIYRYPTHMSFFTTPELLEIGGMPLVTPFEKPTRLEALRYYRKVAEAYQLQIVLHERVTAVSAIGAPRRADTSRWSLPAAPGRAAFDTPGPWSWRWGISIIPTCSACPAKTCRTFPTTIAKPTRITASASSSSAGRTPRAKPPWSSIAPART